MELICVGACPYEDYDGQILNFHVSLEDGEVFHVGDSISVEMMDDTYREVKIEIINPKYSGDYAIVSKRAAEKVKNGEWATSRKIRKRAAGPCLADFVVLDLPYHEVKTEEEINARKAREEMERMICLSPFRELHCGKESIYDYVQDGYTVPWQVIAYLRIENGYYACPGYYDHPFKTGEKLLGPYAYTDGKYYWDRDMWKYVLKYHVILPDDFVKYAMSDEGAAFITGYRGEQKCNNVTDTDTQDKHILCMMPNEELERELKDF